MSCITITLGDRGENHKGMQIIGNEEEEGYTIYDLYEIKNKFENKDVKCELYNLNKLLPDNIKTEQSMILIIRNGVDSLSKKKNYKNKLFQEQKSLDWDKKVFMYGKVVNKYARFNVCYNNISQEPDYINKKGRIVEWDSVPLLKKMRKKLGKFIQGADNLIGEGNYYYDISKTGISYHADKERKKVIGIRLGSSMPLCFQWFMNNNIIGHNYKIELNHGDIYVMNEVAKGMYSNKIDTCILKHAAGCDKYTLLK